MVDLRRVQVGAKVELTAAACAKSSKRRRGCAITPQNCGTVPRSVAGRGGGKAAEAASALAETQAETQAEKVWQARLEAGECLASCDHWHGFCGAGVRTGSASAGAGTGASGSKSGSESNSNGSSGGSSGRGSGSGGGSGKGSGGGVELQPLGHASVGTGLEVEEQEGFRGAMVQSCNVATRVWRVGGGSAARVDIKSTCERHTL